MRISSRLWRRPGAETLSGLIRRLLGSRLLPVLVSALVIAPFGLLPVEPVDLPEPGRLLDCAPPRVLDGDTLEARCPDRSLRLRLWGLDAPEMGQHPWGERSREALSGLVRRASFQAEAMDHDRYGRLVVRVRVAGEDVGLALVKAGWATVNSRYVRDPEYRAARREARRAGVGIWRLPGAHQRPWEWRRLNPPGAG